MKLLKLNLTIIYLTFFIFSFTAKANERTVKKQTGNVTTVFNLKNYNYTESEMNVIHALLVDAENKVRNLMPKLDKSIRAKIEITDQNLDIVGGVFGRAEAPGLLSFTLSKATKGGVVASATTALTSSAFHELHHLARGWTIKDNKFGNPAGIPVATVNEGLASVFSEVYTNQYFDKAYGYPEDVADWLDEIMALPKDANYAHWVGGFHPDGRSVIGYRLGRFVVHKAAEESGKSILELSEMTPDAILALALEAK